MYYIVTTEKSFEQASSDLESEVKNLGFGVLHIHDLGKRGGLEKLDRGISDNASRQKQGVSSKERA